MTALIQFGPPGRRQMEVVIRHVLRLSFYFIYLLSQSLSLPFYFLVLWSFLSLFGGFWLLLASEYRTPISIWSDDFEIHRDYKDEDNSSSSADWLPAGIHEHRPIIVQLYSRPSFWTIVSCLFPNAYGFLGCCSSLYCLKQFDIFSFQRTYITPPSTPPIVNVHVSPLCRMSSFSRRRIRRHHSWFHSPVSSFTVKPLTTVLFLLLN